MKTGDIASKAIELLEKHGKLFKPDGIPGQVQSVRIENFNVVYTTPFSGVEIFPGQKMYTVDIWYNDKKVFSEYAPSLADIKSLNKSKRSAWVEEFFAIN